MITTYTKDDYKVVEVQISAKQKFEIYFSGDCYTVAFHKGGKFTTNSFSTLDQIKEAYSLIRSIFEDVVAAFESFNNTVKEKEVIDVESKTVVAITKESEAQDLDEKVASTILKQIGGNQFIAMTGATHLGFGANYLQLRFKGCKKYNSLTVTLNSLDLYDIRLCKISRQLTITNDTTIDSIYADQLRGLFETNTGLATSLTRTYH